MMQITVTICDASRRCNKISLSQTTVKGVALKHAPAPPRKEGDKEGGGDQPEIATMLKRVTLRPIMNKTDSMQVMTKLYA